MNRIEVFIAVGLLMAGLLTLTFRNRRQFLIGFRIGYTYQSERAWKKTNTFAGVFMVVFSLFLLLLAFMEVPINGFVIVMIAGTFIMTVAGTLIAKRTYEEEDISTEAPKRPGELIRIDIKPYLLIQLSALALYFILLAVLWNRLPERIAIHFNAGGNPDNFAHKSLGAVLLPLIVQTIPVAMTAMLKEPGFAPQLKFSERGWRAFAEFMTAFSLLLTMVFATTVLYNAGFISGRWISYSAWLILAVTGVMIYRLLRARGYGS